MNEEQLKKDRELLEEWKFNYLTTVLKTKGEPFGMVHWIDEIRAAQKRMTEAEVRKKLFNDVQYIINTHQHKAGCGEVCKAFYELRDNLSPNPKQDD